MNNHYTFRIICLVCILLSGSSARSEIAKFDRLTIEDGLSQNTVFCILQDSRGFMWFGTQDGLNKYDGYEFTAYRNNPNDLNSLSHNVVFSLVEDQNGNLWIGTYGGGMNKFDPQTNYFTTFTHDPKNSNTLCDDKIWSISCDNQGLLWIGTEKGLDRFSPSDYSFLHYKLDPDDSNTISSEYIFETIEANDGSIWIVTRGGGLDRLNPEDNTVEHFINIPGNSNSLCDNRVRTVLQDHDGNIWIGTWGGGITVFDPVSRNFVHYKSDSGDPAGLTSNIISSFYQDRTGIVWIGTWGGGINRYNPENDRITASINNPANLHSISSDKIRDIFESESGLIWIGTDGGGINVYDRERVKFNHFVSEPGNTNSLNDNSVNAVCEDSGGDLWIGTYLGGLNRYDQKNDRFIHYTHNPADPGSISNNYVIAIRQEEEDHLWIGTGGGGLNRLDINTGKFEHFRNDPNDPNSIGGDWVLTICQDNISGIWLGTYLGGLNKLDYPSGKFERYLNNPEDNNSLSHNIVTAIIPAGNGKLWVGTFGGLNKFDPETGKFKHYLNEPANPNSISSDHVSCLFKDSQGSLWIGTSGYGLNRYKPEDNTFERFDTESGLPNNVIHGILEDGNGKLWISTNKGISMYDTDSDKFTNYKKANGLQSYEFNVAACYKGNDGQMYFGGINGINVFFPDGISLNPYIPPVAITSFQLFNKPISPGPESIISKDIAFCPEIELSYLQDVVSFEFASLCYNIPELNQYAYKLEGFDKDWNYIGHRRFVTFTNLPAGNYTFKVKGSNHEGIWNETGTSLNLTVFPPPWNTWWAYTIYLIAFIAGVFWYVRLKTLKQSRELTFQRIQLENEKKVTDRLRKVDRLKDEFIANTSHELRTPLNGIIGIAESLLSGIAGEVSGKVKSNLLIIISAGKRLASLVNDILDYSKLKNDGIELLRKQINLKVLTDIVIMLSRPLLHGKNLKIINAVPAGLPNLFADENRIQQVMHNLIGNAVKFTEAGVVKIDAEVIGEMAEISVMDTGIGIPTDKLESIFKSFEQVDASIQRQYGGTGLGLAISRQLIELHGGSIRVDSEPGKGSTFIFTMPLATGAATAESKVSQIVDIEFDQDISGEIEIPAELQSPGEHKILVVDDERINQQVLNNHLRAERYSVTPAYSGMEALKLLNEGAKFDLILLDIMMPKMSGYEVCQKIREKYLPSELPVIMITAKDQVSDLIEGFTAGANDYIAKPFSKGELIARIKTHLNLLKINLAYGRFVPLEFIRTLGRDSILDVQLGDQVHGKMTVLFSDIRSFTKLSESMTAKENFDFLNSYLRQVIPSIRDHQGFIDKYIGDAIMALFPRNPDDAVKASIEALNRLQDYNKIRTRENRLPIQIGIGLNSGELMLGTIGDKLRMDGTVISDAVNLASRLEGLTKKYGVSLSVSEHTLKGLENINAYHHRFLGKVQVKGKLEPVSVFEIYDGDPDEIIELKLETKDDFEMGLISYFERQFAESVGLFKKVLDLNPHDKTARLYLERSAQFVVQGVDKDWQGIEIMDSK